MKKRPRRPTHYTPESWPGAGGKKAAREAAEHAKRETAYTVPWKQKDLPKRASVKKQLEWVHAHLFYVREVRTVEGREVVRINYSKFTEKPPCGGALTILERAVVNPDRFIDKVLPLLMKNVVDPDELVRRDKMQVADIEEILKQFEDAGKA